MTTKEQIIRLLKQLALEQQAELNITLQSYQAFTAETTTQTTQPVKRGVGRPKKIR